MQARQCRPLLGCADLQRRVWQIGQTEHPGYLWRLLLQILAQPGAVEPVEPDSNTVFGGLKSDGRGIPAQAVSQTPEARMPDDDHLLPCPFCGSDDVCMDIATGRYSCEICFAEGPGVSAENPDGRAAWNKRSIPWCHDMEAAPKDGTTVLLYDGEAPSQLGTGFWSDKWNDWCNGYVTLTPQCWAPWSSPDQP